MPVDKAALLESLYKQEEEEMNPYRIILADDHILVRHALKRLIEEADQNRELIVIGEAGDGIELLDLLKKQTPDMILLDLSMPRLRGFEATREIKAGYPHIKILILTMHQNKESIYQALSAGADGYLLKEDTDEELLSAIRKIRNGELYMSPLLTQNLANGFVDMVRDKGRLNEETLSTREREVLTLLAEGKTSREISNDLYISPRTVEHHRASIGKKLNIKNMIDLFKYALQNGYLARDF